MLLILFLVRLNEYSVLKNKEYWLKTRMGYEICKTELYFCEDLQVYKRYRVVRDYDPRVAIACTTDVNAIKLFCLNP